MGEQGTIWSRFRRVLIVVRFTDIESIVAWREALKDVGLNVHECRILSIVANKKERQILREMSSVTFLAENDFGLMGQLKNEEAKNAISPGYDSVIVVGDYKGKVKKLIDRTKANVAVGLNTKRDNFNILLESSEVSPSELLNFVKKTLEKIS